MKLIIIINLTQINMASVYRILLLDCHLDIHLVYLDVTYYLMDISDISTRPHLDISGYFLIWLFSYLDKYIKKTDTYLAIFG